jgi:hypothetical protein
MSILDSIKGTRKLSFNHWRYRLLHWAFNVKNPDPKNIATTGMPKYLYTHFCPLFHLTNLIAILSPVILFIKVMVVLGKAFAAATAAVAESPIWAKIGNFLAKFKPARKPVDPYAPPPPKKRRPEVERRATISFMIEWTGNYENPDPFWTTYGHNYETLTEAEVKALFVEYMPKILAAREESRIRKEKRKQRMIFWINFSRVFIKWSLNVFYVLLSAAALYGLIWIAGPAWSTLCWVAGGIYWLFTDVGCLSVLWFIAKMVFFVLLFGGTVALLMRLGWIQKFGEVAGDGLSKLAPPFYVVGRFFDWIGKCCEKFIEFCKMFYEENCPPIKLVTDEEAAIAEVAEKED